MAILRSNRASSSFIPATRPQHAIIGYPFSLTVSSAPVLNDLWYLGKIPAGCTLLGFEFDVPDLDTDASPTCEISVGDTGSATRFTGTIVCETTTTRVSSHASPTAATGGIGITLASLPRRYTSLDYLLIKVVTASAALSAAVNIVGHYYYTTYPKYRDPGQ